MAASVGRVLHGLALTPVDPRTGTAFVVWSDAGGLHGRPIDAEGVPAGPGGRLGGPCAGGLALDASGWIACREASRPVTGRTGAVRIHRLPDGAIVASNPTGPGRGVAIAVLGRTVHLAWGEGATIRHAAVSVGPDPHVSEEAREVPAPPFPTPAFPGWPALPRPDGDAGAPGGDPSDADPVVFWTARSVQRGTTYGGLYARPPGGTPRILADARAPEGHADVVSFGGVEEGGFLTIWRDRPETWADPHAFVRRFDGRLQPLGESPRWVGRADVEGPLRLVPCFDGVVALFPHTDDRRSVSLGIRRLDRDGKPRAPELPVYTYRRDHVWSDGRCGGDGAGPLLLVVGERTRVGRPAPTVWATTYRCGATSRPPSHR